MRRLPVYIVLAVSLAACTSSVHQSTSVSPRSPSRSTHAAHPSLECDGHLSLAADLDGDGRTDLVYHDFVRGNPELGVCTAAGSHLTIPGIGQSELLEVIALPADGRHVVLFGATSVSAQFYEVAAIVRGRLTKLRLPGGAPLTLTNGLELGESKGVMAGAFGCRESDSDDQLDLFRVSVTRSSDRFLWHREAFVIQGAAATPRSAVSGVTPATGGNPAMLELARSLTEPCHIVAKSRDHREGCRFVTEPTSRGQSASSIVMQDGLHDAGASDPRVPMGT